MQKNPHYLRPYAFTGSSSQVRINDLYVGEHSWELVADREYLPLETEVLNNVYGADRIKSAGIRYRIEHSTPDYAPRHGLEEFLTDGNNNDNSKADFHPQFYCEDTGEVDEIMALIESNPWGDN